MKNKKLHIYCDGGFGNRFNSLISGLVLYEEMKKLNANTDFCISWPKTIWTMSPFFSIFEGNYEIEEKHLFDFLYEDISYDFFIHVTLQEMSNFNANKQFKNLPEKLKNISYSNIYSFNSVSNLAESCLNKQNLNCIYGTNAIPSYCTEQSIHHCLKKYIKFTENITNKVHSFIDEHDLKGHFYGIQIRATDHGDFFTSNKSTYQKYINFVEENKDKKIFICSDEKNIEQDFKQYPNVVCFEKTEYPKKLNENLNTFNNNIIRSDTSVQEAMVDMLILSKSTILNTSPSTFLETAVLLQRSGFEI